MTNEELRTRLLNADTQSIAQSAFESMQQNTLVTEEGNTPSVETNDDFDLKAIETALAKQAEVEKQQAIQEVTQELQSSVPSTQQESTAITRETANAKIQNLLNKANSMYDPNKDITKTQQMVSDIGFNYTDPEMRQLDYAKEQMQDAFPNMSEEEALDSAVKTTNIENHSTRKAPIFDVNTDSIFESEAGVNAFLDDYYKDKSAYNNRKLTHMILKTVGFEPRSIKVQDGLLYLNDHQITLNQLSAFIPDNEGHPDLQEIKNGTLANIFDWGYLQSKLGGKPQQIIIDTDYYFYTYVRDKISSLTRFQYINTNKENSRKYMFTIFPSLVTLSINGQEYNRYDNDQILDRKLEYALGIDNGYNARKQAFKDGCGFSLHRTSTNVAKWAMHNVATYACNRGKRGILRYSFGLLARVGIFGVLGAANLVIQGLHAGFTPVDELNNEAPNTEFEDFIGKSKQTATYSKTNNDTPKKTSKKK